MFPFLHFFYCSLSRTFKHGNDKAIKEQRVGKQASEKSSDVKDTISDSKEDQSLLNNEDNLIPRLVANGTKLVQSWEDQYYVVNEYRANAHQVCV